MPLTRYQIRNEYGLADPELYRAADRDDPEALLEGVAMAGLVGVLRQLGDLAEFAAEIFHDLHEEVMATATRGHGLVVRVQQLEADFPSIEKALLSQTHHSAFFSNPGVDWHPNLRSEQNLITRGDLPRFVMDSYEECRGPPRLFLLDKFDRAGVGACLKRYTDPSFFKVESASTLPTVETQREKRIRKVKKKGSRWRNGETPEVALTSHAKLHELFLEERIQNGYNDPARRVKLKKRHLNGSAVDPKTGKSYMKKFMETLSPEHKLVSETSIIPPLLRLTSDNTSEPELRIVDISTVSPVELSPERESTRSSPNVQEAIVKPPVDGFTGGDFDGEIVNGSEPNSDSETYDSHANIHEVVVEKQLAGEAEHKTGSLEGSSSDGMTSEVDTYVDALATMDSEMDTDNEYKTKDNLHFSNAEKDGIDSDADGEDHLELQTRFSDTLSSGNSSTLDGRNNSFEKDRASLSHSDTLSDFVGDTPSYCNGAAEEFPSTEICGAQNFEMSSNEHSVIVEPLETSSKENMVSHNTCIEEDVTPDSGDTSCSAFFRDTSPTLQHSELATSSSVVSLAGSVLDETPSDEYKVGHESLDIDKNLKNVYSSMSLLPDDSSQTKDEFTDTSTSHPGDGLDVERLIVSSDLEELASEDQSRITAMNEMLQTHCADENLTEFTRRKIDSPDVSISTTEEQLLPSALPQEPASPGTTLLPNYSNVSYPDEMASKLDEPITPSAINSESIPNVVGAAWSHRSEELVDSPQTHGLIEQQDAPQTPRLIEPQDAPQEPRLIEHQFSDLNEGVPQLESILADTDLPHSREECNAEEKSRTMEDEELQASTRDADEEVGDVVSLELPSTCPTYPGHEDHVYSDVVVPNVETVAVPSAAVAQPDNDVNDVSHSSPIAISSPSRNFMNLHGSLPGFEDSLEKGSELDEVASPQSVRGSEGQKEVREEVSPDSKSHSRKSATFNHSTSEVSNDGHNFSLDEQTENSMAVFDVTSESHPSKSSTYDHFNPNLSDDGHDFSLDEQTENNLVVHDATTASTFLEMRHLESDSESLDQNPKEDNVSSPPTSYLPEPETSSGKSLELEANQVDMECLPRDGTKDQPEAALEQSLVCQPDQIDEECPQEVQASINSSSLQSDHLGSSNHIDKEISRNLPLTEHINQEICFLAPEDSCVENLPSQPSTSEFLPESASQELDATKQTVESLESTLPSLVLAEATAVSLDDMPPLPPLPPMQWRMGKQNPSVSSMSDLGGGSQGSFLPIQQLEVDETVQFDMPAPHRYEMPVPQRFDIPAPQRDVWKSQNPLFISVEDEKFQHVSEPSVGNMVHPAPHSLQLPTVVNDANYEHNSPNLGGAQSRNPFLPESEVSDDRFGHNHFALEGEKVQYSSNPSTVPDTESETSRQDPESSHEAIIQPLQQLQPETGLEPKVLQQSFEHSEREQGKPLVSVTVPTMVDDQPQNSFPTSEGETAESQPEAGLEIQVLQQSFKNSEQEQGKPLASVTVPTMVDGQLQISFATSEGETAQSQPETGLDTQQSLENSECEQGKPLASVTVPTMVDGQPQNSFPISEGETARSSNNSDVMMDNEVGKSNGLPVSKLPRPRNPLIDAVAAHGQSKLRKVTERVRPEVEPKVDERDSWLQQIRTKSFNLKPAPVTRPGTVTRPSVQGPATNLRVAAILEKANAIRQATAGSDEDDDDSWSDS